MSLKKRDKQIMSHFLNVQLLRRTYYNFCHLCNPQIVIYLFAWTIFCSCPWPAGPPRSSSRRWSSRSSSDEPEDGGGLHESGCSWNGRTSKGEIRHCGFLRRSFSLPPLLDKSKDLFLNLTNLRLDIVDPLYTLFLFLL